MLGGAEGVELPKKLPLGSGVGVNVKLLAGAGSWFKLARGSAWGEPCDPICWNICVNAPGPAFCSTAADDAGIGG